MTDNLDASAAGQAVLDAWVKGCEPTIKHDVKVSGLAAETIPDGESGHIVQRSYLTSTDPRFGRWARNLLVLFVDHQTLHSLDRLLVVIRPDHTARIHATFPVTLQIRAKANLRAGSPVSVGDVADIRGVEFRDALVNIEIEDGDQIVWLFRESWRFCLYFDLSGTLKKCELPAKLGECYRDALFSDLYTFLDVPGNIESLLEDGWFPFLQLIGGKFQELSLYYEESEKYQCTVNDVVKSFDRAQVDRFSANWWDNPVFQGKKQMIGAGIDAYFQGTEVGYINCIKNLAAEAEGIIRFACYHKTGSNKPSTKQLKEYVVQEGRTRFAGATSLGFPELFARYLDEVVFAGFDISAGSVPTSRHAVAHGVASLENFTQARALQLILLLDQIYFFLGK